jgi:hypothetical protein
LQELELTFIVTDLLPQGAIGGTPNGVFDPFACEIFTNPGIGEPGIGAKTHRDKALSQTTSVCSREPKAAAASAAKSRGRCRSISMPSAPVRAMATATEHSPQPVQPLQRMASRGPASGGGSRGAKPPLTGSSAEP